jgi:hypothetical protein
MTRQIHDQFGKELLAELVQPLGQVNTNQEIHAETYHADLGFIPSPTAKSESFQKLGLLGQMVRTSCLLEYFWKPPTLAEVRGGLVKLFTWHGSLQRVAKSERGAAATKRKPKPLTEDELPRLWIVTTTIPKLFFTQLPLTLNLPVPEWGEGVYLTEALFKTAIVAIDLLPLTPETVWLRLLGRGETQEQAVETVLAWVKTDPSLSNVLEIIYKWCTLLDTKPHLTETEKELLMNLSEAYQEARQQAVQQGRLEMQRALVENLLKSRFGKVDRSLSKVVDSLVQCSPQEVADYLLQWSREKLIAEFGKKRGR